MNFLNVQHHRMLRQTFLVMKITTLLLLISIMTVSAATNAQQITLKTKGASLQEVLSKISDQTGFNVFYSQDLLTKSKPVTVDLRNTPLATALNEILAGQDLTFNINDHSVVIKEKELSFIDKLKNKVTESIQNIDVTGRVIGEDRLPLAGATVQIKDGNNSTATDANGFFTLKNVEPNATIVISFIGYDKKEIPATTNPGAIKLSAATSPLDEVKVIAYGQTTDRLSVGNVSSISAKQIAEQPVNNPLLTLEGRVPGVIINQVNGLPGSAIKIQVQSQNSINSGNNPLYVVDGVPYAASLPTNLESVLGRGNPAPAPDNTYGNPFSYLNPDDIESISVLKDADATSIYGSRAANGAVLITTKKGKAGKTQIDINLQSGVGKDAKFIDMMNTQQFLAMRRQAFANDGLPVPSIVTSPFDYNYDIDGQWDTKHNTNWQKVLLGGSAQYTDVNGTVSGGTENIQFLAGGTYHRETTVFPGNAADTKASVHFSLNSSSENKKFRFQLTGSYLEDSSLLPRFDLTSAAIELPPNAPMLFNPDGSLNWAPTPSGTSSFSQNPMLAFLTPYQSKVKNLMSNAVLSYEFFSGLTLRSNFGYTNLQQNEFSPGPLSAIDPEDRPTSVSEAQFGNDNSQSWIVEPQLNYSRTIGKGHLNVLLGGTIQQSNINNYQILGFGFASDRLLNNIQSASTIQALNSSNADYKYAALFSRLNYDWDGKYLINLSARRDGSSRFGAANRFHDFWSMGAGWVFSEEKWLKEKASWLSFGKIKGSYGTTGNDQIGNYSYLSLYSALTAQVPYQSVTALRPLGLPNPYLQWELTKKLSIGMDLGFLKDRIILGADYFHYRSSNELLGYSLPNFVGFSGLTSNFPATIQSTGYEFTLTTVIIRHKDFTWTTNFNLTVPVDFMKLIAFPGLATSTYASSYVIGQSIYNGKLYHFMGVDPTRGVYQFSDGKGGVTSTPESDYKNTAYIPINQQPRAYGGITNTIHYKALTLDFLFQFRKQTGANPFKFGNGIAGAPVTNQPSFLANGWTKPGDLVSIQRYSTNFNYNGPFSDLMSSDAVIEDASFIKLKNASLSWQLPDNWVKRIGLRSVRVYGQGQNLLTFTKYSNGVDPETQSPLTLPPLRVITFGAQLGL
ncbi:MAG TPA: SusC/RagA family TonB-linked outer membrane protein [Mucilaginibacter sp.]|jgi:TonB-linked SusC/RagA family outer membrane protein